MIPWDEVGICPILSLPEKRVMSIVPGSRLWVLFLNLVSTLLFGSVIYNLILSNDPDSRLGMIFFNLATILLIGAVDDIKLSAIERTRESCET